MKVIGLWFPVEIGKRSLIRHYVNRKLEKSHRCLCNPVVVNRGGLSFELDTVEEIDLWIYLTGWWEKTDCQIALSAIRHGETVLDVGAHIGSFALRAARVIGPNGHVFAFEPNPNVFARLLANAKRNTLGTVTAINIAVGDRVGEAKLFLPRTGYSGDASLFEGSHHAAGIIQGFEAGNDRAEIQCETYTTQARASSGSSPVPVSVVTIDEFCRERGIDCIHFVKIDTEGSEPAVLLGGQKTIATHTPRLMVECNKRALAVAGWKVEDFLRLIWNLGYRTLQRERWSPRLRRVVAASDIKDLCNLHCIPH